MLTLKIKRKKHSKMYSKKHMKKHVKKQSKKHSKKHSKKQSKKHYKKLRGGSNPVTQILRGAEYQVSSFFDRLNGGSVGNSPDPTVQPIGQVL